MSNRTIYCIQHCSELDQIFSEFQLKNIPYLALTGDLWFVFSEDLGNDWPHYTRVVYKIHKGTQQDHAGNFPCTFIKHSYNCPV